MENKYDEHIQKLLDEGEIGQAGNESSEVTDYKALYRMLQMEIPLELSGNFRSNLINKIVAKQERKVKIAFAVLIGTLVAAAGYFFTGIYTIPGFTSIAQSLNEYKFYLLIILPAIAYFVLIDYRKIKPTDLLSG